MLTRRLSAFVGSKIYNDRILVLSKELQKTTPFFNLSSQDSLVLQIVILFSAESALPSSASMKHAQSELHMELFLGEKQTLSLLLGAAFCQRAMVKPPEIGRFPACWPAQSMYSTNAID